MPYQFDYAKLQPVRTGTNGLTIVGSAAWPNTTGNETVDKMKAWLDKPVLESQPSIKRSHAAIALAVVGVGFLAYKNHWI